MNKQPVEKGYVQVKCSKCDKRLLDVKSADAIIKCAKCGTLNVVKR